MENAHTTVNSKRSREVFVKFCKTRPYENVKAKNKLEWFQMSIKKKLKVPEFFIFRALGTVARKGARRGIKSFRSLCSPVSRTPIFSTKWPVHRP